MNPNNTFETIVHARKARANALAAAGSLEKAIISGSFPAILNVSLSEALVLGLIKQNVRTYVGVFGHGSTDLGEVLRVYAKAGVVRVIGVRSEIEASHTVTALRWQFGETAAVFTSIGPGALQAIAASLAPASDSIGVYYLLGDETTHDEGFNMQQVPQHAQASFLKLASVMGSAYALHTGEALPTALKRGALAVHNPVRAQPFYLFLPMNIQPKIMVDFNLAQLPVVDAFPKTIPADESLYIKAVKLLTQAKRVVVKTGNGARLIAPYLLDEFTRRADAAYVHGPIVTGLLSKNHPRNMTVGGSKGSISGNAVMQEADLVVTIGARAVCQWDSSGTAWKNTKHFIAINTDLEDATHYNGTLALTGDAQLVLSRLVSSLQKENIDKGALPTPWFVFCQQKRAEWDEFLAKRIAVECLYDPKFKMDLLTQPAAIAKAISFAQEINAVKYFDAGDVQANGFQLTEDEHPNMTFTDTGASYMGFAVSAILASAITFQENPPYPIAFTGDGSFMMNPQILIDGAQQKLHGMILLFDNRRMSAISSLQHAQYGQDFATDDEVTVDYVALANSVCGVRGFFGGYDLASLKQALQQAHAHKGLSLVHVPVYAGEDIRGGLGAYGNWNVGNWCEAVQHERQQLGF